MKSSTGDANLFHVFDFMLLPLYHTEEFDNLFFICHLRYIPCFLHVLILIESLRFFQVVLTELQSVQAQVDSN
ncbi:MAG: hypothetical protein COA77_06300 [Thaumarchaeota archaeon]|nr:MAG: hypothetical protein COA77_06300 [Nitrososphaerota archaeon]